MELDFATANNNKIKEIKALIPSTIKLLGLADINCTEGIPETQPTIEGNASQKAFYVYNNYHINCFADDTGLEIEALEGRPGVLSARYAGENKDADENINKVLNELQGVTNRNARFKTVISLVLDGKEIQFEGIVNGTILTEKHGVDGFGYDPIFAPDTNPFRSLDGHLLPHSMPPEIKIICEEERKKTFAEMTISEKNKISHRALAVNKLVAYFNLAANSNE